MNNIRQQVPLDPLDARMFQAVWREVGAGTQLTPAQVLCADQDYTRPSANCPVPNLPACTIGPSDATPGCLLGDPSCSIGTQIPC